ncbi:hypothetical protein QBC38DRAFT_92741 [Podospora fimiseda]|uniref:Uncharacterized protein n=1 Tax=Podospora fimiseda TaxID=252190 RepID=A0AAN7BZ54_9PEZI|nr:hypothetical protein QBC38DRAFT_92741 [Podospora fimiseda]
MSSPSPPLTSTPNSISASPPGSKWRWPDVDLTGLDSPASLSGLTMPPELESRGTGQTRAEVIDLTGPDLPEYEPRSVVSHEHESSPVHGGTVKRSTSQTSTSTDRPPKRPRYTPPSLVRIPAWSRVENALTASLQSQQSAPGRVPSVPTPSQTSSQQYSYHQPSPAEQARSASSFVSHSSQRPSIGGQSRSALSPPVPGSQPTLANTHPSSQSPGAHQGPVYQSIGLNDRGVTVANPENSLLCRSFHDKRNCEVCRHQIWDCMLSTDGTRWERPHSSRQASQGSQQSSSRRRPPPLVAQISSASRSLSLAASPNGLSAAISGPQSGYTPQSPVKFSGYPDWPPSRYSAHRPNGQPSQPLPAGPSWPPSGPSRRSTSSSSQTQRPNGQPGQSLSAGPSWPPSRYSGASSSQAPRPNGQPGVSPAAQPPAPTLSSALPTAAEYRHALLPPQPTLVNTGKNLDIHGMSLSLCHASTIATRQGKGQGDRFWAQWALYYQAMYCMTYNELQDNHRQLQDIRRRITEVREILDQASELAQQMYERRRRQRRPSAQAEQNGDATSKGNCSGGGSSGLGNSSSGGGGGGGGCSA